VQEATVYVTADGSVPLELVSGNYGISGGYCFDVKGPQKDGESDENYAARVDSFATGFTKTFLFTHTLAFTDLSILMPNDPAGIVASVSQPASTSGTGNRSVPFTVTFKSNVTQLVLANNVPVTVKLLVRYKDNIGNNMIAYRDIKVQDAGCYCPAQVPTTIHPSGWLTFMCRNLGVATKEIRSVADIGNIDVNNFREYHGDWYRFGVHTVSLLNYNGQYENDGQSGNVPGWSNFNTVEFPVDLLSTDWKSAPDNASDPFGNPCPGGWRLPTIDEWNAVINTAYTLTYYQGTTVVNSSSWGDGGYNNILKIGDYLFLPAAG
jgi:hypothetical protein